MAAHQRGVSGVVQGIVGGVALFVQDLQGIVQGHPPGEAHDFPAKNLEVEITEYCLMNSIDVTLSNIEKLHAAGVQIALDDFGTGYSSLSYLTKIPVDLLKIDKSLVDEIEADERSLEFVKSVVTIGHGLGCEVICEGVEETNQIELLKEADVDFIQGYVWGKPLSLDDAKKLK